MFSNFPHSLFTAAFVGGIFYGLRQRNKFVNQKIMMRKLFFPMHNLADSPASRIHTSFVFMSWVHNSHTSSSQFLQGIAGSIGVANFSRAFLIPSLISLSSGSVEQIARNFRAFSRLDPFYFSFTLACFPIECQLSSRSPPEMCQVFVVQLVSHHTMGRNRKWVLEDNLSQAMWRTILRGPRPPPGPWQRGAKPSSAHSNPRPPWTEPAHERRRVVPMLQFEIESPSRSCSKSELRGTKRRRVVPRRLGFLAPLHCGAAGSARPI